MKKLSSATRAIRAITMIYAGATLTDVCEKLHISDATLYRDLLKHYHNDLNSKYYRKVLKVARANKASEKVKVEKNEPATVEKQPVYLIETGFVIDAGLAGVKAVLETGADVVIPLFCIGELQKQEDKFSSAKEFLNFRHSRLHTVFLREEVLCEKSEERVEPRVIGVAAMAVDLALFCDRVVVLTNSGKIKRLVERQGGDGLEVNLIPKAQGFPLT